MKIKKSQLENLSNQDLVILAKKLQEVNEASRFKTLEHYLENSHEGQIKFHKANKRIRLLLTGNRFGKSTAGCVEMHWAMLGTHPFRKNKIPLKGLIVATDFENQVKNVIEPKLNEWAPTGAITKIERNQQGHAKRVIYSTGSYCDIFSHDQDKKVFEGADYDIAWFDEPPPRHIYTAVWRGMTDRGGIMYITGTPITEPWLYREYKKAEAGDPILWGMTGSSSENAKNLGEGDVELGLKRLDEFAAALDPEERHSRLDGGFLQMQGLIFKDWLSEHHKITPFAWPKTWPVTESIDPHPSKPWAVSWVGTTENVKKILLRSGKFGGTLEEIADQILHQRSLIEIEGGSKPPITRCLIDNFASVPNWSKSHTDPTARRLSIREEMENMIGPRFGGAKIEVAPKNVRGKIDMFKRWIRIVKEGEREDSKFYVFNISENDDFCNEIENYVWDTKRGGILNGVKDQPKKENDDILDTVMQIALTDLSDTVEKTGPIRAGFNKSWRVGSHG